MCSPRFWKGLSNRPFSPHGRALRWRPKLYSRGFHTDGKDELCSGRRARQRSEEHTSELQSRGHLVCRLLLEKKKELSRSPLWQPGRHGNEGPMHEVGWCVES